MAEQRVVARAWRDPEYRQRLMSDPHAALAEEGVEVDPSTPVRVVETSSDEYVLLLPQPPRNAGELTLEELIDVAGGLMYGDI